MHVHVAAFSYFDIIKIRIWQPRLNFAIYTSELEVGMPQIYSGCSAMIEEYFKSVAVTTLKLCMIKKQIWPWHEVGPFLKSAHI